MGQEQSNVQSTNKSSETSPVGNIVVVKHGKSATSKDEEINKDPDMKKLDSIKTFYPLMKVSPSGNPITDLDVASRLDSRSARVLCARYEKHLKLCAEAVAFDQNAIASRLKELDHHSSTVLRAISERHKKLQSQAQFIQTVEDVKRSIDRVEITLQNIIPLMERLNEMLPEEEKMEPFLK